jgi:hypothetical protein
MQATPNKPEAPVNPGLSKSRLAPAQPAGGARAFERGAAALAARPRVKRFDDVF